MAEPRKKTRCRKWTPYRRLTVPTEKRYPLTELLLLPVRGYTRFLSPLLPPRCRFSPTCSHYCMQALREWGILRGAALTLWRLLRCNPFGKPGLDPVPKNKHPGLRF